MEMVHFIPASQRRLALLAAQADSSPVLICGANGTGKGAIAQWIHSNGLRATRALCVASQDQPLTTQILNTQGGTLVIPEIGEWNFSDQKILLGFLKTKTVILTDREKVPQIAQVRILGTTSQTLEGRAQGGLFNIELLERLNELRIEMPSLIHRKEEFEDIVLGISGEISRELHKEYLRTFSQDAWFRLRAYDWPGNLRELRNVLRIAVTAAQGDQIEAYDLPDFGYTRVDFRATRAEFEKIYILDLLQSFDWEIDKTCQMTRIDKTLLLTKIKNYGITEKRNEHFRP